MTAGVAALVFAVATGVVVVVAPRMTRVADGLASRSRIGAALFGAVFLGASTSLPGVVVTVSAALRGEVGLAAANALGGIVAQTMFLALADVAYRRSALQRQPVSAKAIAQLVIVVGLLALVVLALGAPRAVAGVHATTPLLVVGYLTGMMVVRRMPGRGERGEVQEASSGDVPIEDDATAPVNRQGRSRLWLRYAVFAAILGTSGVALSFSVEPIAASLGMNLTAAGGILTALATSSPELLTAVAAARRGALRLAVGDIAGGNAFDVLFLAAADVATLGGVYGRLGELHVLLTGVALLLNAVLCLGFVRQGVGLGGRIAPESLVVLGGYVVVTVALVIG